MFPLISFQYHLLSSSSLIFLSQIVIQIANAALIYNWGKKGVSQNDFRLPKMKPTWGHFPFTDLMESCFYHLLCDLLDKMMIGLLFGFHDFYIQIQWKCNQNAFTKRFLVQWLKFYHFSKWQNNFQVQKSDSLTNLFSIDNLAILKQWKIQIIFSSKKSLHW